MENKPYVNKGSMHLHGVTWTYVERTPFAGEVINGNNRKSIIERVAREYKEKNPDASAFECYERGKHYVNRERKHYKSYLKGKNSYAYKGGKYLVEDLQRKMVFEQFNKEIEEKLKELELKKEQENVEVEVG
jgi:hypothetical protein